MAVPVSGLMSILVRKGWMDRVPW